MSTETTSKIQEMTEHVKSECSTVDTDKVYSEMLDECYSFDSVGGPFQHMSPSKVLQEMDPISYRCGCNDYIDSLGLIEIDGENYQDRDVDKAKDEFIDGLDSELTDLEQELEDADEDDVAECARISQAINELRESIKECRSHTF